MENLTDKIRKIVFEEIQRLEEEAKTQFSRENVETVTFRIFFNKELPTYDILTRIRVIKNVATVFSIGKTGTSQMGSNVIDVRVSYIPIGTNTADFIDELARTIKLTKGVRVVKVMKIGDKVLNQEIGPVKLVY